VAVVQYTFTHKQYTEQHNETEYIERNAHNNKTAQIFHPTTALYLLSVDFLYALNLTGFLIVRTDLLWAH
jgi:hypothetical protein